MPYPCLTLTSPHSDFNVNLRLMNFNWSSCPNNSNNRSRTPQSDHRPRQPKWPQPNWQMTLRRDPKESLGQCQKFRLETVLFFWFLCLVSELGAGVGQMLPRFCLLIKNCKHVLYWQHKSHLFNLQTSFTLRNLIKKVLGVRRPDATWNGVGTTRP